MALDLRSYLKQKQIIINETLNWILKEKTVPGRLSDAMVHAVMAGGKRLRPILCIAAAVAVVDGASDELVSVGCAIELIHTYSLIHDDLPAMDDDALRRGVPTCHVAFDEATAILAGDGLLTLGFELLSNRIKSTTEIAADTWLDILNLISKAAGCRGMVEGQMRDVMAEAMPVDLTELESIQRLKTGALMEASVKTGAMFAGASDEERNGLQEYAMHIGMAFQVTDDLLNVEGNPNVMGKAAGTDVLHEKSTYPALIGLTASKKLARNLIDNALHALHKFDNKADPLRAIARYVIERNK